MPKKTGMPTGPTSFVWLLPYKVPRNLPLLLCNTPVPRYWSWGCHSKRFCLFRWGGNWKDSWRSVGTHCIPKQVPLVVLSSLGSTLIFVLDCWNGVISPPAYESCWQQWVIGLLMPRYAHFLVYLHVYTSTYSSIVLYMLQVAFPCPPPHDMSVGIDIDISYIYNLPNSKPTSYSHPTTTWPLTLYILHKAPHVCIYIPAILSLPPSLAAGGSDAARSSSRQFWQLRLCGLHKNPQTWHQGRMTFDLLFSII